MNQRRQLWTAAVLVASALGLGAVLLATQGAQTSAEKLARSNNVFDYFRRDELLEIRIERPALPGPGRLVQLRRAQTEQEGDVFELGPSGHVAAEPAALAEFLRSLEFATWERRVDGTAVDLDAWGLRSPRLEVRLQFRAGDARLVVGKSSDKGGYFAQLTGSAGAVQSGLLSEKFVQQLQVEPNSFRERLLLPYAKSELAELSVTRGSDSRVFVKDALGFRLGTGGPRLEPDAMDRLLFQLSRAVLSGESAPAASGEPNAEVVVIRQRPQQGPSVVVELGGSCGAASGLVRAQRREPDPVSGCVPSQLVPDFETPVSALLDLSLSTLAPDEIDHVEVVGRSGRYELVRSGGAFELRAPDARPLALDKGNELLNALTGTRGELLLRAAPTRKADGALTIVGVGPASSTGSSDEVRQSLELWAEPEGFVVKRADDGALLLFPASAAWFLDGDAAFGRDPQLLQLRAPEISGIRVSGGREAFVLARDGESWKLAEPSGFAVDARQAEELALRLSQLSAARFLPAGPGASAASQPEGERLHIELEVRGQSEPLRLSLGQRTRGGYVSELSTITGRFVLAEDTVRLFQVLPIDRSPFVIDPASVEQLEVRAHGESYVFERRGDSLVPLDPTVADEIGGVLLQSLNALSPLGAVHTGPAEPREALQKAELVLSGRLRQGNQARTFELSFGALGVFQGHAAQLARARGTDATFYVDRIAVEGILDSF